jgi:DHA1 family bicyclomycin/chloramphenicol resistance-like MFS transporter
LFYIVPVIAPAMGKFILTITTGMGFSIFRYFISILVSWFWKRQLKLCPLKTRKIFKKGFIGEFKELIKYKRTLVLPLPGLLPDLSWCT